MQLVLGLGNPGPLYARTRHNVGFRCLEAVAARLGWSFAEAGPAYRSAVGAGPGGPLTLLLPLTYMNRSGDALVAWSAATGRRVGVPRDGEPDVLVPIVVCDDLHLPLGSLRIRGGGGDGGQQGLASVLRAAGGQDVPRLRLGVGPAAGAVPPADWAAYVLAPFAPAEETAVAEMVGCGAEALLCLLEHGWRTASERYNRRGDAASGPADATPGLPDGGP